MTLARTSQSLNYRPLTLSLSLDFRVLIHVFDENDHWPIIDPYPQQVQNTSNAVHIYLNESLPINALVLSLSITDRDSGDHGRVTWKLLHASAIPFELVRLTESTGELRTRGGLDRERIAEYNLTLEATDHGRPAPKSSHLNIRIFVLDENDNTPTFREQHINATINEHVKSSSPAGYDVYHVQAIDADQGRNGEIAYALINNDENLFRIDPRTGMIRALVPFDRQQQQKHTLQVEARDQGNAEC